MALITRVSRLFRADFNAVLDRIEEPDLLLKQAVREMEDELAGAEHRLRAWQLEHAQLCARSAELERSLESIEQELDVCFASGEEALARGVVKRKLEAQRLAGVLARKRQALQERAAALAAQIEENRTRLESTRQKAEILAADLPSVHADEPRAAAECVVRQEEVDIALLREKQKRSQP